ncbi:MAG: hypothetical protein V3T72_13565, partial [Thermoanaerobaculia bacterium]
MMRGIYIFDSEESFRPYRLSTVAGGDGPRMVGAAGPTAGYLVPHEHGNYAALIIHSETRPVRFVYKQYIHQLLHDTLPGLPLWLRHGLAEYYSTFEIEDGYASIGLPVKPHLQRLVHGRGEQFLPLSDLLTGNELPRNPGTTSSFLARSWTLVHYLMTADSKLSAQLPEFARKVLTGVSAREAFEEAFDIDLRTLETQLDAHVRSKEFKYARVAIDRGAHPIRMTPMKGHEVLYRLGDLLAHNGSERYAEAAVLLESALELKPDHGLSWAGLGYLAELQDDDAAALESYRKAAGHAEDDSLVQYLYGASLIRSLKDRRPENEAEQADLDAAIAALRRATELRPDFAPAWASLGYAHNLEPEASVQAVEVLEKAADLLPARVDVAFNLLLAYARVGDRVGADAAVAKMRRLGADEATLARSREVLLQMDYRDANRLVRDGRLDDAIAVFARIQAETANPALQRQAAERLEKLEPAAQHNRFGALYNQAANLLKEGRNDEAAAVAEQLLA